MKGIPTSFPASIDLATLTPATGVTLNGVAAYDFSGGSVRDAGDLNGDGVADLIIGAWGVNSYAGASYVVFGKPGIGSSGNITLSSLNGSNGFVLSGVASSDTGYSVSSAGDVNKDGVADLIIGAIGVNYNAGASYVVFGKPGIGSSGSLTLSSLNGGNGFVLTGKAGDDYTGYSVSSAGDINGDGVVDLIIGASTANNTAGASYVVFGKPGLGSSGSVMLSSLDGGNGFVLSGMTNSQSGYSVSGAGDINGDGVADLIIGAPNANSNAGASYVVFGKPGLGSSGSLTLSSLNGSNGFVLSGVANSKSGTSVSGAGDVNKDGVADLIIGAYGANSYAGASYVVFGKPGIGSSGNITLSSLNGSNGFVLTGKTVNDASGWSVSGAGDINGDGVADLLISAYGANSGAGVSYVVFGKPGLGSSGSIELSSVNGSNGFVLMGGAAHDDSGWSVSGAGDINGDGVVDLIIGARGANSSAGTSYVVFGDIPPTLVRNRLTLQTGSKVSFNSTFLSAYDRNHKNNTLIFFPTNVTHGQFESVKQPGVSLSNFTQPQLLNGTIRFVHDGSSLAPSYNITVCSPGIAWTGPSAANITFTPGPTTTSTPVFFTTTSSPSAAPLTPTHTLSPSPSTTLTPTSTISASTPTPFPSTLNPTTTISPSTTPTPISTSTPTLTPTANFTPPFSTSPSSNDHSILPILIGAVVGGLAALAALGGGIWYYRRKKQAASKALAAKLELMLVSQGQSSLLPPPSMVASLSELKISSRSHSSFGEMKISFSVSYQDLEFDEKDKLGSGAFGTVYKGIYKFNQVAIKQLHSEHLSEEALDELKQEAGILGSMQSDFIVQLRGICLEAPHYCLVMELMPKGSLYGVLQNSPELSLSVRYQIGLDVCYGLYHLHEKNILHRDLKSLNILLDDRLRAKITDFGLSKIKLEMGSQASSKGMKGTLGWMAPELFQEEAKATTAIDIYAFGMVLWEMMVNPYRIPFQGLMPASLISAKLIRGKKQETIPDSCPPKMAQLIEACWQEPGKRPSAKELAKSLSTIFKSSPEQLSKVSVQSQDKIVQREDLLTAAF